MLPRPKGSGTLPSSSLGSRLPHLGRDHGYAVFLGDPNYWWPEDRAWYVVTDTDFDWATLLGLRPAIEEILALPVIDAYPPGPRIPLIPEWTCSTILAPPSPECHNIF